MSYSNNPQRRPYVAGADLSSKRYYAVKLGTDAQEVVLCGDGEKAVGLLQNKPVENKGATVAVGGVAKGIAGGVIAKGAQVASDGNGKLVTAASGDFVIGTAEVLTADGDIFPVDLDNKGEGKAA